MPFVNSYGFDAPSRFNKAIPIAGGRPARYLAVGARGTAGLAALIETDGSLVWSRIYANPATPMAFVDGIEVGKEGFLLLSAVEGRPAYVIVRIDPTGTVLWSRTIAEVGFGPGARVLRHNSAPGEFLVTAWPTPQPANYQKVAAQLYRLGSDGAVLGAVKLTGPGRIFDVAAVADGYVLVGDHDPRTAAQFAAGDIGLDLISSPALVAHVDPRLSACQRWWDVRIDPNGTPYNVMASLRAATVRSDNAVFVAGGAPGEKGAQLTMAMRLAVSRNGLKCEAATAYTPFGGGHRPHRIGWSYPRFGDLISGDYDFYIQDLPVGATGAGTVVRLDQRLAPQALHGFKWQGEARLSDLRVAQEGAMVLAGTLAQPGGDVATLVSVDWRFQSCKTRPLDLPKLLPATFGAVAVPATLVKIAASSPPTPVQAAPATARLTWWCGKSAIDLTPGALLQSPYLNLQAAGSDGSDASRGILLRWFLAGVLGDTHLPKGSLATTATNFNKPDDFVRIYRAPWTGGTPIRRLSFTTDRPRHVDDGERLLVFETGSASPRDLFHVRFLDAAAWQAARQNIDAAADPAGFLAAYGAHPVEIELRGRLAMGCDVDFPANPGCSLRIETRSVGENRPLAPKQTSSRRILGPADGPRARLYAENLRSLRVQGVGTTIGTISFLCYEDVLAQLNSAAAWSEVGRFALTDDTATALARLEDPARFQVHGLWRKYNDGAFVNIKNYQDRWNDAQAGLRTAVQTYVQLSQTDPAAKAKLNGAGVKDGEMKVSYLDLLQLAATDFHAARMLGLGHVDADAVSAPGAPPQTFVHLAEYLTTGDLGDGAGARPVQHLYMSLPTSEAQPRLPITPLLSKVDYGLTVTTATGEPYWLTDAAGYTPDGIARYIRLYPDCPPLFEQEKGFFDPPNLFDLSQASLPVFYGVEHRLQGEPGWRRPEIVHDRTYLDTASPPQPETRPIPFGETRDAKPFPHRQTEPGVHEYAVYGVNLFSRASPPGPALAGAATTFVKANRLQPPSELQAQFIQPEWPLVLTSPNEQAMLAELIEAGGDKTLVRLCFNYDFAQESAYDFAHAVEIFHRRNPPAKVIGGVAAAGPAADPALFRIETRPYTYASTKETATPTLAPADKASFLGGALAVGSQRLIIEDIAWPPGSNGSNPIFLVRRPTTTGVKGAGHALVIEAAALDINSGDLLMAVENMASAANWGPGNPLGRIVALGDDPSWTTRTENFTRADQNVVSRRLRGVWATATVIALPGEAGHYRVAFDDYVLKPHPQAAAADPVNWFRGVARVPVAGRDPEDRRMLKVLAIGETDTGRLELRVVDDSGEAGLVATGAGQLVNYFPGYRIHLHADPAHGFDEAALMPGPGEGSRTTLLGMRSVDPATLDGGGKPYRSLVGVPQLVTAVEVLEPGVPLKPRGLKYATPPDAYGKASYTLTVDFAAPPFAAAFYRADAFSILEALYEPQQLAAIRAAIFPPDGDPFFANRFDDLFAFFDSGDSLLAPAASPLAAGGNYGLPLPNAAALDLAAFPTLIERKERMKAALLEAFVALTEQPLVYALISTDPAYAPTNAKQRFRNAAGESLAPGASAPMAKRPGGHRIQFTDFTLEGSMNPNTVYFYFARELGNRMQLGEPGPIFGPVKLVNLNPPAAPQLRKIGSVPFDAATGRGPEVRFEVLQPSSADPVSRLRIYRTGNSADALSVRTMAAVKEIDLTALAPTPDGTLVVADDFAGEPFIPFGEPLYYRLAWMREVRYENAAGVAQTAWALSEPTGTLLANLVDVVNPDPPVPAVTLLSTDASSGDRTIALNWPKTTHNGTYYVCQLHPSGNWSRLAALKTNAAQPTFALPAALPVADDGDPIHYRFKIDVENSSGLLNLFEAPITVDLASLQ